jgi:hypothetical protein
MAKGPDLAAVGINDNWVYLVARRKGCLIAHKFYGNP